MAPASKKEPIIETNSIARRMARIILGRKSMIFEKNCSDEKISKLSIDPIEDRKAISKNKMAKMEKKTLRIKGLHRIRLFFQVSKPLPNRLPRSSYMKDSLGLL
jgi:hypothetical protein